MAELIPNPEFDRAAWPALTSYREALPGGFVPPALADMRARAHRRAVIRGASLTAVTAACVLAAAGIAVAAWPDRDGLPPTPGGTASSTPTTGAPSAAPETSPPTATSAPAPAIWPDTWSGETVVMPPTPPAYQPCPAGRITFAASGETVVDGMRILLSEPLATGDLTGDGRPEAVANVHCERRDGVDSGDGSGHLLVITRDPGGTFTGLAHVGPDGENYPAATVRDGKLTATVQQRYGPAVQERTYRWNGTAFVQIGGPTAFPG